MDNISYVKYKDKDKVDHIRERTNPSLARELVRTQPNKYTLTWILKVNGKQRIWERMFQVEE